MAMRVDEVADSAAGAVAAFATVRDLRCWTDFVGVRVTGPMDRPVEVDDDLEVAIDVAGRTVGVRARVEAVVAPHGGEGSRIALRTTTGPVSGTIVGTVTPRDDGGSRLRLVVEGSGRGAVRLLEGPLQVIGRRWAAHQLAHLANEATKA